MAHTDEAKWKRTVASVKAGDKGTAEGKQFVPQPKPRFAVKGRD